MISSIFPSYLSSPRFLRIGRFNYRHNQPIRSIVRLLPYLSEYRTMSSNTTPPSTNQESSQPPLSDFVTAREERKWNRLSDKMSAFHEWFKQDFNTLYELADGSFNARGLTLARYLDTAKAMSHHLTMHHTIEERYIFPTLAKFMPKFGNNEDGEHIASHRGIHEGLDTLEKLVGKWKENPSTYSPMEMKACLDGFREVLFHHLDEEVADLRGENLRKYMTLADVESLPI